MKPTTLSAFILLFFLLPPIAVADEKLSLNEAFAAYQADIEASRNPQKSAQTAYQIGQRTLAKDDKQLAYLAINYAKSLHDKDLPRSTHDRAKAYEIYKEAQQILAANFDAKALENIDVLYGLGLTAESSSNAIDAFDTAIDISVQHQRPDLAADIRLTAVQSLLQRFRHKAVVTARRYLRQVENYIEETEQDDTLLYARTEFISALFDEGKKRHGRATDKLENVVKVFERLDYDHPMELRAHAKLVELYETMHDSEQATEHCLAIGLMKPWQPDMEPEPLYRKPPEYPKIKLRRRQDGWVRLTFTIDEKGFVREPKVIESKGGEAFEKAAIESLNQWRYAPRFENGQAVSEKDLKVQLDFKFES